MLTRGQPGLRHSPVLYCTPQDTMTCAPRARSHIAQSVWHSLTPPLCQVLLCSQVLLTHSTSYYSVVCDTQAPREPCGEAGRTIEWAAWPMYRHNP